MAIDYRKRLKVPAPAVSLEKVAAQAPGLVSLYKTAAVSLAKHDAGGQRAAVYLVLDRSGNVLPQRIRAALGGADTRPRGEPR